MLDFGIVDPHLHVWDTKRLRYPWLDTIPKLNRSFCLNDYTQACGAVAVDRMVFVQCECEASQYRDEVAWVSELAKRDARIKGIVAWAPLEKGDAVLGGCAVKC